MGADSRKLDTPASAKLLAARVPAFENGHYLPPGIAETSTLDEGQAADRSVASGAHGRVVIRP